MDVMGFTEVNKNWYMIDPEQGWRARTRSWWEAAKSVEAHNVKDCGGSAFQPGGNLLHCIDRLTHRVRESGRDPSGLGRWSWLRFRGRHDITTTLICAYRPCKPSRNTGINTVYSQHLRYMDDIGDERDPRQAILEDLTRFITECRQNNDQIIVMMDANEDVTSQQLQHWLQQNELTEAIASHRQERAPATYHRGSKQIDGIFVSNTINPIASGFLPFGTFPSDHRAIWIEVSFDNMFGCKMERLTKPQARRLKCNDPKVCTKWKELRKEHAKQHKLNKKLKQIWQIKEEVPAEEWQQKFETIMELRNQGIRYADQHCRNLPMGEVPFSPTIKQAGATIDLWKGVIKKKQRCRFSMSKIRKLERQAGVKDALHRTMDEANEQLQLALMRYKRLKKDAKALRVKFLEQRAIDIAKEKGEESATVYKQLIQREKQRESARRIKYVLKKVNDGGVTKIEQETADGNREEITTKEGIERGCIAANKKKYLQSRFTPCLEDPLRTELGFDGDTAAGRAILDGTYIPPDGVHPYATEFFNQLQRPTINHEFQATEITAEAFKEGWKKMKEKTSAGISGLHFGHMKTSSTDPYLAQIEANIANIAYTTGYSPRQWHLGVSVMLKKKENVDLVSKLRTITLLEADFNFNNKILGRETIAHAERNEVIAKEQYGSRKQRKAIDHAIHKAITYDVVRQHRIPAALCSNDAKSCYDRIVHSIASLAYQRLDIPKPPVLCMLRTIQRMKHHIRTTYGDSKFTMSSDGSLIPFQGVLQGNGASPVTWVLISSPLLNMLREMDNGGHIITAISKQHSHIVGYSYVDDTDLLQIDMRDKTITIGQTLEKMQEAINRWEGGLKMSGGAIVPQKSFVYPIGFQFNNQGKWKYSTTEEIDFEFTVKDEKDITQQLQKVESSEGRCTLGVVLAPDGNNKDAVAYLRKKAETWASYIQTGHINRTDAWQALDSTIIKTIQYPIPALCLTQKECNHIMDPIIKASLPKSSIARTYPHKVLYGPKEEGGLDQTNLYIKQGTTKIALLTEHLALQTMTGELLRCSIEAAKVEVGVGGNIFELNYDMYGCLCTDSMIKFIWKFAFDNDIIIQDNVTANLELRRQNDIFLMEQFVYEDFSEAELQHINRCRLYMQAVTLADVTNGHGNKIEQDILNCKKDEDRPHYYGWPTQPRPYQRARQLWKRALKKAFPRVDGRLELQYTLGRWIENYNDWIWYLNVENRLLYKQHTNNTWQLFRNVNRAGRIGQATRYRFEAMAFSLPNHCHRATIKRHQNGEVSLTGWDDQQIQAAPNERPQVNAKYSSDTSMECLYPHFSDDTFSTRRQVAEALNTNSLVAVSDGSYKEEEEMATAAVVLEDTERNFKLKVSIITPGDSSDLNAYRAELSGMLAIICYINNICEEFQLDNRNYTIHCDGKSALDTADYYSTALVTKSNIKHFDIIQAIVTNSKQWQNTVRFQHIKGHQDDVAAYRHLSRIAQLNVQADKLAKKRLKQEIRRRNDPTTRQRINVSLPMESCAIFWKDQQGKVNKVVSELEKYLNQEIARKDIRQYWIDKGKFERHFEKHIDWPVVHKSFKAITKGRRHQVSKWLTGFCGVGKKLKQYRHQSHANCPRCNAEDEDVAHILQCNATSAKTLWESEISKLQTWMEENDGDPDLITAIIENVKAWRDEIPYPVHNFSNRTLRKAIRQQDRIGWQNFLEGFLTQNWRKVQTMYLKQIKSHKSSLLWMSRLQQKMWGILKAMWKDRNDTLHRDGNAVHRHEIRAIDAEILSEWQTGIDILPRQRYEHLFRGERQHRLNDNIHQKMMWLCSIWSARERYGSTRTRDRDIIASDFYKRWKEKLLFQKQNKLINEEITAEWNLGLHTLPIEQYEHLFQGSLQMLLAKQLHIKKRWLCRLWDGRDRENDEHGRLRDMTLMEMYNNWRNDEEEE